MFHLVPLIQEDQSGRNQCRAKQKLYIAGGPGGDLTASVAEGQQPWPHTMQSSAMLHRHRWVMLIS